MDIELRQYLAGEFSLINEKFSLINEKFAGINEKFAGINEKFAGIDESSRGSTRSSLGIDEKFAGIDEKFVEFEGRIMERVGGRIDAVEERLKDFIRAADHDLETKIIGEFHKWGRTSDMRTRQAITDVGLLGERVLAVEDRISRRWSANGAREAEAGLTIEERMTVDKLEKALGSERRPCALELARRSHGQRRAVSEARQVRVLKQRGEWLLETEAQRERDRRESAQRGAELDKRIADLVSGFGEFMRRERPRE